jgi:FixJ family two-component response regulator
MNEMNGFDLQKRLAVPIIFITSYDDASTREQIEKSGAAAHLKKPFEAQTVLDAIRRAVVPDRDGRHDRDRDGAQTQTDRPL